jgi:hypothetical protein
VQTIASLLIVCFLAFDGFSQCNGSNDLCDRKYDEVAYLTTHNAFNSSQGSFTFPNQTFDIAQQLDDGVRAFMLDAYNWFGTTVVYHGTAIMGTSPLVDELTKIYAFLDTHPNEIVTVIFESNVSANDIESCVNSAGLTQYLYTHTLGSPWPTLQTMINANTRLVIMSDVDDANPGQEWYHYMWEIAVETHYSANDIADFNCDYNRGDSTNDLFIFNHFITSSAFGTGMPTEALIANSNPYFINRALQCQQEKAKFPNFVTVDFYELGDCKTVVDQLNGLTPLSLTIQPSLSDNVVLCPNPATQTVIVQSELADFESFSMVSLSGQDVTNRVNSVQLSPFELRIDISLLENGLYIIRTSSTANKLSKY